MVDGTITLGTWGSANTSLLVTSGISGTIPANDYWALKIAVGGTAPNSSVIRWTLAG